ncbi:hypothetical protein NX059_011923 [Plenodomus lindquistii]|nr:hypothetical protein NX059_011923 [Plenodomus lindquistii]
MDEFDTVIARPEEDTPMDLDSDGSKNGRNGDVDGAIARTSSYSEDQLDTLNSQAREYHEIKLSVASDSLIYKPTLESFYYNEDAIAIDDVPQDLRLDAFLANFNNASSLASHNFSAKKSEHEQSTFLTRMIWYYGTDHDHTFTRFYETIRHNIIGMAFLWGLGWPTNLCDPIVAPFCTSFLDAWRSQTLKRQLDSDESAHDFGPEEDFIKLWKESEFDLLSFNKHQLKVVQEHVKHIMTNRLPEHIREKLLGQATELFRLRDQCLISADDWNNYGPRMVIAWALANDKDGRKSRKMATRRDLALEISKTEAGRLAARDRAKVDEMEGGSGNILAQVPWNSPLLKSLLQPVDEESRVAVEKAKSRKRHSNTPWMKFWDFEKLLKHADWLQDVGGLLEAWDKKMALAKGEEGGEEADVEMEG